MYDPVLIYRIVILCVNGSIHSKTEENRYALYTGTVYIFARIFEHAMTTLINTYFNTEFRINLQDLHSSTRLNADLSLNHRYLQKYHTMVDKNRKLLILEKKIANEFLEY